MADDTGRPEAKNSRAQRRRLLLARAIANSAPNRLHTERELLALSSAYAATAEGEGEEAALVLLRSDLASLAEEGFELAAERGPEGTRWAYAPGTLFEPEVTALNLGLLRLLVHENRRNAHGKLGRLEAGDFVLERAFIKLGGGLGDISIPPLVGKKNFDNRPPMEWTQPASDILFRVIDAIQGRERIRFDYRSAAGDAPRPREFEPELVFRYLGNDYVSGRARYGDGADDAFAWRTFRLSRVSTPPEKIETIGKAAERTPRQREDELKTVRHANTRFYRIAEATVAVREGTCLPIRALGQEVAGVSPLGPGWDVYRLENVDRQALWEKLVLFGTDMRLLGPEDVLADYRRRLSHLAGLGR